MAQRDASSNIGNGTYIPNCQMFIFFGTFSQVFDQPPRYITYCSEVRCFDKILNHTKDLTQC